MLLSGQVQNTMRKPMRGILSGGQPNPTPTTTPVPGAKGPFGNLNGIMSSNAAQNASMFHGGENQRPWMVDAPEVGDEARQRVEDALYERHSSRFEPEIERDRAALELRLSQQGIGPESEAYATAMERFMNNANDIRERARTGAIATGGAEQSREFGMGMDASQFILDQNLALKNNQQTARQRSALGSQGLMSGISGLASTYFSDARLKSKVVRIGTHPIGVGIYEYEIFGVPSTGVIAQEVLTVRPELVSETEDGALVVDYAGLVLQ